MSGLPDFRGQVVAVVAGGQSALELQPALLQGWLRGQCRVAVVNLGYRLFPDADLLYAADSGFWLIYHDARRFPHAKVCPDDRARPYCAGIELVTIPRPRSGHRHEPMIREPLRTIGNGGGNGAFQAVNLVAQLGAARILLAGVDYCGQHWHPDHPPQLRNPTPQQFKIWARYMDQAAPALAAWGVEVVNLSTKSILRAYPHEEAESALTRPLAAALPA